jgi:hypothetical protein
MELMDVILCVFCIISIEVLRLCSHYGIYNIKFSNKKASGRIELYIDMQIRASRNSLLDAF